MILEKYKNISKSIENAKTDEEIYRLAQDEAIKIFEKIESSLKNIEEAKEFQKNVEKIQEPSLAEKFVHFSTFGFCGKDQVDSNKEKIQALSEALCMTNESVSNMNALIQESIGFSCQTIVFARAMIAVISKMMEEGFKDRDGNMISLTKIQKEIFCSIKDGTEQHIRTNQKHINWQREISSEIILLKEEMEKNNTDILRLKKVNIFMMSCVFILSIVLLFAMLSII